MHGINKDTNRAGVYHNPMIRLIYKDVGMRSAKIWYVFPTKLNGWAFNLADFPGDMKLQIALNYGGRGLLQHGRVWKKAQFLQRLTLKTYFTEQQIASTTEVVNLKPSSSMLKWPNNDILSCQRSPSAAFHHITDQWDVDRHKIHCRQRCHKALLYYKSPLRPPCYQTTPGIDLGHS